MMPAQRLASKSLFAKLHNKRLKTIQRKRRWSLLLAAENQISIAKSDFGGTQYPFDTGTRGILLLLPLQLNILILQTSHTDSRASMREEGER